MKKIFIFSLFGIFSLAVNGNVKVMENNLCDDFDCYIDFFDFNNDWQIKNKDSLTFSGSFKDGEGIFEAFWQNGVLAQRDYYKNYLRNGKSTWWSNSGKIIGEGLYKNNLRSGKWSRWRRDGSKLDETFYKNGVRERRQNFHPGTENIWLVKYYTNKNSYSDYLLVSYTIDQKKEWEKFYINDLTNGKSTWFLNEKKTFEGYYKNGIPDGKWTYFNKSGLKYEEKIFQNGVLVGSTEYKYNLFSKKLKSERTYHNGQCISGC